MCNINIYETSVALQITNFKFTCITHKLISVIAKLKVAHMLIEHVSCNMRFPTVWVWQPAKAQTGRRVHAV